MKQHITLLFLIFLCVSGTSQTVIPLPGFQAVLKEFPTMSGDTITAQFSITDFSNQWRGQDLNDRDHLVLWRNCKRYPIIEVVQAFSTEVIVKLDKDGNPNLLPGVCALLQETPGQMVSHLISGITDSDKQCIDSYYRVDALAGDTTNCCIDTSVTNELQTLSTSGAAGNISITSGNTITLNVNDADANPSNELQTLSTNGGAGNISISSGNMLTLNVNDADSNSSNEGRLGVSAEDANASRITSNTTGANGVRIAGSNTVKVTETTNTNGGSINFNVDTAKISTIYYVDSVLSSVPSDPDSIQRIGNVISLRDGSGSVNLSDLVNAPDSTIVVSGTGINVVESPDHTFTVNNTSPDQTVTIGQTGIVTVSGTYPNFTVGATEVDGSITNELQTISTSSAPGNITLSNGGGTLNLNINDADANPSNEIQTIDTFSIVSNQLRLSLTQDNQIFRSVDLSPYVNTDAQTLSRSGLDLSISGGNTVTFPTSNGSTTGWLTGTDWSTFNNKVGGSGVNPRLAFWDGTGSLSSTAALRNQSTYLYTGYTEGIHIDGSSASYASGIKFRNSGQAHCTFGMKGSAFVFSNTSSNSEVLWPSPTDRLSINMGSGIVNIPNLSGSGTRVVTASPTGDLLTSSNFVTGSGVANRVAFWTGSNSLSHSSGFLFDPSTNFFSILGSGSGSGIAPLGVYSGTTKTVEFRNNNGVLKWLSMDNQGITELRNIKGIQLSKTVGNHASELEIHEFNDQLINAEDRYGVTYGSGGSRPNLFRNLTQGINWNVSSSDWVEIDLVSKGWYNANGITYPEGDLYIYHYYLTNTENVQVTYQNSSGTWFDASATVENVAYQGGGYKVLRYSISKNPLPYTNYVVKLRIQINAPSQISAIRYITSREPANGTYVRNYNDIMHGSYFFRNSSNQNIVNINANSNSYFNQKLGIKNLSPYYDLDITGSLRVTDRSVSPVHLAAWASDGQAAQASLSTGLSFSGGSLTVADQSPTNELITAVTSMGTLSGGNTIVITEAGVSRTGIIPAMTGATAGAAGVQGVVPAPAAGQNNHFLRGDGTWQTVSSGVTGSGAATQVAYWNGTSSLTGNSNLFWNNTNVRLGIGTSGPSQTLHVNSSSGAYTNAKGILMSHGSATQQLFMGHTGATQAQITMNESNFAGNSGIYINSNGAQIGIKTPSATRDLDVNGNARIRGAIYDTGDSPGTAGQTIKSAGAGAFTWGDNCTVEIFTTPGTYNWVKPANCKAVYVKCIGGGGGGAGGNKGAAGVFTAGGEGGDGGGVSEWTFNESELILNNTVIVGAGGTGGAGATLNNSNGAGGTDGENSVFKNIIAEGGRRGDPSLSKLGMGITEDGGYGARRIDDATSQPASVTKVAGCGGGGGGSISSSDVLIPVVANGETRLFTGSFASPTIVGSFGGAAGAASTTGNGTNGSTPGSSKFGGGGGGGGAARNSVGNGGNGGNGRGGAVLIITYF